MKLEIQENINLAQYTTYKIGGPARYFAEAKNEGEIAEAVSWAQKEGARYFILGGGSNILVSDNGFDGLVLKIQDTRYKIQGTTIEAGAGVDLPELVKFSIDNGLKGIEWASGIPGTFGGAVRGNAGAFGGEIKDILISVKFLDESGSIKTINNKECNFSYRDSIFKQNPNYIVLSATLEFDKGDTTVLRKFSKDTIEYRAARHPLEYGSCGSVFKAVDVNFIKSDIFARYPRFRNSIKNDPFPVVPMACFIDEAGIKGHRIGGAMISTKHPNFFVNYKDARAEDVVALIDFAKQRLFDRFAIMPEEEVQYVGF
ncbi:MAG: UDP-N-acetylmuramate dehydrogenase [Candidatus Spechtbacterales bacterium]